MEGKILLNSYIFLQSVCDVRKRIKNAEKTPKFAESEVLSHFLTEAQWQ